MRAARSGGGQGGPAGPTRAQVGAGGGGGVDFSHDGTGAQAKRDSTGNRAIVCAVWGVWTGDDASVPGASRSSAWWVDCGTATQAPGQSRKVRCARRVVSQPPRRPKATGSQARRVLPHATCRAGRAHHPRIATTQGSARRRCSEGRPAATPQPARAGRAHHPRIATTQGSARRRRRQAQRVRPHALCLPVRSWPASTTRRASPAGAYGARGAP